MSKLVDEQERFLLQHGISVGSVFDATGLGKIEYRKIMKSLEKTVAIGVTACRKGGHTLRSRSGHCIQCNPAALAFQSRYTKSGFVYIAGSETLKVIKVGFSGDVESRIESLNELNYGGASDWTGIYWVQCESAGKIEFDTHERLSNYAAPKQYVRGGTTVDCLETFSCGADSAILTLNKLVSDPIDVWQVDDFTLKKYQFDSVTGSEFIRKQGDRNLGAATPLYRSKSEKTDAAGGANRKEENGSIEGQQIEAPLSVEASSNDLAQDSVQQEKSSKIKHPSKRENPLQSAGDSKKHQENAAPNLGVILVFVLIFIVIIMLIAR